MHSTLNSAYNEVALNKKSAIMKENIHTKYTPFTYNDLALNEKPPITKQNLHIFFLLQAELSVLTLYGIKITWTTSLDPLKTAT